MGNSLGDKVHNTHTFVRFYSFPALLFLAQRLMLSTLGIALFLVGMVPTSEDPIFRPYYGVEPVVSGVSGALLGVWQRFDVVHFMRIAQSGYVDPDLAPFFPLYPLTSRFVGNLFGGDYLLGGFVVSNIACLLLLCVFYAWMQSEWQDEKLTKRAMLFMVWFPTSFFLFVPYSESMFLLFAIASLYAVRRGKWLTAGLMGALAAFTRVGGVVMTAVILIEWVQKKRESPSQNVILPILSSLMPLITFLLLTVWRAFANLPNLVEIQASHWNRVPAWPIQGVFEALGKLFTGPPNAVDLFDLEVVLGMLLIGVLVLRKLPLSLGVYHWGLLFLTLSQTRIGQPLSSQARFALVLFPAYIVLAQITQYQVLRRSLLFAFLAINLLFARWYIMWGWIG